MSSDLLADRVRLSRDELTLELSLWPFSFTLRRRGRRLLGGGGLWAAEGSSRDQLLHFTEAVLTHEQRAPAERALRGELTAQDGARVELALRLHGGRSARAAFALEAGQLLTVEFEPDGQPMRSGIDWGRRPGERLVGLGLRHGTTVDQAGRDVQLGADRRYTGPDCPPEMLELGGIPQGDCAPLPWLNSSRGYAVWCQTEANGTCFEMGGERIAVSTRSHAGKLRVTFMGAATPLARLRAFCRLTGFPALLPEWGYGFWKSRDIHEHQDDVVDDHQGFRRHRIPLDAIVIDSPWATQYNTWQFNPYQFPDAPGMVKRLRDDNVRTVLWATPWINLDSRDGQIPPQPESEHLHAQPASNYEPAVAGGHLVRDAAGQPLVGRWWMGTGSPVDLTSPAAERWWREAVKRVLELGVEGIKADDGDGFYIPDDARLADGRRGAEAAWALGGLHRRSLQRALDEVHPGRGVLFGRSGWTGQQALGHVWGGDQASDFWSLRALVVATLTGACSGFSNFSHDIGGYLGHRLTERCPPELLIRWLQFGCFTPLMHAHGRMPQEPWHYSARVLDLYRGYVLLHEQLVPYVRMAARTAARTGLPIIRPLCLIDPADARGWSITDAYGYGPSLWVAPVLDEGAREREVSLPRGRWIETWSGRELEGGGEALVEAPLHAIPVWVRAGSIVVSYPQDCVAQGVGDDAAGAKPLRATLWGEPRLGHTAVRLADGTRLAWRKGRWTVGGERVIELLER
ncbi:MAG TPA: TIM-barrel domain-containing protein [Solirubrobacteraceae bacterium]